MTPERALHRDHREDIEGLVHRGRIELPDVVLPDGTASPNQFATVPPGVSLAKAALPYREVDGTWSNWTGAALVGTREPDMTPYLPGSGTVLRDGTSRFDVTRPQKADDILHWLHDITGVGYAPAAFWKVAGWEIGWAANWLEGLYGGGLMGELIVAERQAAAALRAAWISHRHWRGGGSLLKDSGILLAGRALIDLVRVFERVVSSAPRNLTKPKYQTGAADSYALLNQRLLSCVLALEDAAQCRSSYNVCSSKIGKAIEKARDIVEAIGLFAAAGEEIAKRVVRVSAALVVKERPPQSSFVPFAAQIDLLSERIESLIERVACNDRPASWSILTTGDLERLQVADPQERARLLSRVRTDLIYKLVVTRRLDRLFEALPWLAAPSGAFRLTFGGPLGAMAALFELARHREIALGLKARLFDSASGPRLDTRRGKREYGDPVKVRRAVRLGNRAGFLLASSALSHHMVKAYLAGCRFDSTHPLPTLAAGRLDHDFSGAVTDPATNETIMSAELGKPIYRSTSYHRDLPVYMGMMLADLLAAPLIDVFPGDHRDPGFNKFAALAEEQRKSLELGAVPWGLDAGAANRDLLRSMLKSLDTPVVHASEHWPKRSTVPRDEADVELRHFDERHTSHIGDRQSDGGAVRRRVSAFRDAQGEGSRSLRRLVDQARLWPRKRGTVASDDRPLARVLVGSSNLPGLMPVAQTAMPVLWFRPDIDDHIHTWIAHGTPMWSPLALGNVVHAGLIACEVQAVTTRMPLLFGMPISPALRSRVIVPLWTGLAGITADHAHVR